MEIDGVKSVPFRVKAAGPDDGLSEGQFEGYCSVFGNVDSYGDVVVRGAFGKSLAAWAEKGDRIPLLWGHDMADPFSNIGVIESADEDEYGLKVSGVFDMDNPKAVQVYRLAKNRRTTGMSFAYEVRDSEEKDGVNYLNELHIYEASIVPVGANPLAELTAVKVGRRHAKADADKLQQIRDLVDELLAAEQDTDDGPDGDEDAAKARQEAAPAPITEEDSDAKSEEPEAPAETGGNPAVVLAHTTLMSF